MKIKSLSQAEQFLQKYIPQVSAFSGDNLTIDRIMPLLKLVGNPHKKLKIIHIAGTSGKTSTCYYIASQLKFCGQKVGLTVSPHVDKITERIQIDGKTISDEKFCNYLEDFLDLVADVYPVPSYFEILIAFAYWVFERENVDYAVIETGMGGLHDSTNVAGREDKICVITDIGYDHMHILGNTLPEITRQKAGIIHNNNEVFVYEQSAEIMQEIEKQTNQKNAILHKFTYENLLENSSGELYNLPDFQKRNWLLAEQVSKAVAIRDGFEFKKINHPESTIIPGRMDTKILKDNSILIMDGAHNGQKMQTFVTSFQEKYPETKAVILLALKEGKEFTQVIDALSPITASFILTTFNTSQDLPAKSQSPESISDYCTKEGIPSEIITDNYVATNKLLNNPENVKIITGSFYLLGQVRNFL